MKILRKNSDLSLLLNNEQDFQTNLGWEENIKEFENEILNQVINPIENYETVRYIHEPYVSSGVTQTDIWFYFYFIDQSNTYTNGLDYNLIGITPKENAKLLKDTTESFFRLEFFKTPNDESPDRTNRKLVFSKNLSIPLGEKYFYTTLNDFIFLPVFNGSNYKNKENMYFFWFQDETVLSETSFTGDTFYMTAKFFNSNDGSINDFTNNPFDNNHQINESNDMYYKVIINQNNYTYVIYEYNGTIGDRCGIVNNPIKFYQKR